MKSLLIKVCVFTGLVASILISYESALRNIPNDYAFKSNSLSHGDKVELLILGSSHSYRGINPAYLSMNSFNAAYISQSIDLDLAILNEKLNSLPNLKTVVLPISYHSLFKQLKNGVSAWRMKNYSIYYGIGKNKFITTEIGTNNYDINLKRMNEYYFKKSNMLICDSLGWAPFEGLKGSQSFVQDAKKAVTRHTDSSLVPALENAFLEIVTICKTRNLQLILVSLPVTNAYAESANMQQWQITQSIVQKTNEDLKNVHYMNLWQDERFTDEDFYNSDHLNANGAKKFSSLLNEELKKKPES